MVSLNVNFDNSNKFYFEGEKISGKLEVSIDQSVNVSSILAYFVGECCCCSDFDFQIKSKSDNKNHKDEKIERETYFNDVISLFVATDEEKSAFSKGIYQFPMEYQLPWQLPTSIESPQGYIRYSLHIVADIGGETMKSTHYFTVVSKVDLNTDPSANLPIVLWKHESQCLFPFLCLWNGQIRAFIHVAKKAYVPGEMLTINAEIRNFSRSPINWVKASIVQILKYNCAKVAKRKRIVAETTRGCIMPHDSQAWRSESLCIPAIPPSTCFPKRMITVKYKLYFLIKTSWHEKTVSLKQNLIIGAVPLMECKQTEERGQGEGEAIVNNSSYHYSNLEPCIFGPYPTGEETSASSFSPLYPIYTEFCNF